MIVSDLYCHFQVENLLKIAYPFFLMEKTVKNIHTVSSLTYQIKHLLEGHFKFIQVKGEVSNLKKQSSGHIYFTLKDASSAISVALFSGFAQKTLLPKDGDEIIVEGEISLYAPRGSYQIIAQKISKTGTGDLLMKLHLLKEELSKLGYFSPDRKKPLPKFPKKIGVVTSPTGAVIKDIIHVLSRRYPNFQLILNPVAVQGPLAEIEIAKAIDDFNKHNLVDVMIVGRGGGSLEDLFSFNERVVADAIFRSKIPIISACGHETDFTIADFCADVRAPTPSAAAEIVVVDKLALQHQLQKLNESISKAIFSHIKQSKATLSKIASSKAFLSPYSMLSIFIQNVDELSYSMDKSLQQVIQMKKTLIKEKEKTLALFSPMTKIYRLKEKIESIKEHLFSVNPSNILKKGYCLVFKDQTNELITSISQLQRDHRVQIKLANGEALATIETLKENHHEKRTHI
jgi:exodeoxyribonuclease VII large subunit